MKYKDAIKSSMEMLAKDDRFRFLGYNVKYGSKAYGTLTEIQDKCIETPLAENLMIDIALGMSLEGYRPVVFLERQDFILNGLDAIVNHADKISSMSHGQFKTPLIIRATVGAKSILNPGPQHTQDFTEALKKLISFPVIDFKSPNEIIEEYKKAKEADYPILFVERRGLYETE